MVPFGSTITLHSLLEPAQTNRKRIRAPARKGSPTEGQIIFVVKSSHVKVDRTPIPLHQQGSHRRAQRALLPPALLMNGRPIRPFYGLRFPPIPGPEGIILQNEGIIHSFSLISRQRDEVNISHVSTAFFSLNRFLSDPPCQTLPDHVYCLFPIHRRRNSMIAANRRRGTQYYATHSYSLTNSYNITESTHLLVNHHGHPYTGDQRVASGREDRVPRNRIEVRHPQCCPDRGVQSPR